MTPSKKATELARNVFNWFSAPVEEGETWTEAGALAEIAAMIDAEVEPLLRLASEGVDRVSERNLCRDWTPTEERKDG